MEIIKEYSLTYATGQEFEIVSGTVLGIFNSNDKAKLYVRQDVEDNTTQVVKIIQVGNNNQKMIEAYTYVNTLIFSDLSVYHFFIQYVS